MIDCSPALLCHPEKLYMQRLNTVSLTRDLLKVWKQLGKKIGFPTANIDIKDYVLACPGVYAVRVKKPGKNIYLVAIKSLKKNLEMRSRKCLLKEEFI